MHCNGCMNVAWRWFWGGSRSANNAFFRVKWLQPAMKGSSCGRWARAGPGVVRTVIAISMCFARFARSCALQLHGALEALVAKGIGRGSLEVKLPTIWTDGKTEVGRVRED